MGGLRDQGSREGFHQLIPTVVITVRPLQIAEQEQGFS